ncbi:MAG TPA: HisS family protein [Patescibacteria group bacterium]|nr:HisS family protein [Patescibacteria group bacterium]
MGRPKKITPTVEKAPARLPGTRDILPEDILPREIFLEKLSTLAHTFGYSRIETPVVEDARLFRTWQAGSKDKLISFPGNSGVTFALKPTNVFSLARCYLEYHFFEREKISKWFYASDITALNESEIRQETEYGFQTFGESNPIADSQLINLVFRLFTEMGLSNLSLEVNNIGCLECQPAYEDVLRNFFKEKKYDLCENCVELLDTHPLQILACNNLSCSTVAAEAPVIVDFLCDACRRHFIGVLEGLDELEIAYNLNQKVIGKPWSRKTVFEVRSKHPNGEVTVGAGGHADDLIQSLGGNPAQALGFRGTVENVLTALNQSQVKFAVQHKADVFLVPLGELAAKKTLRLFTDLWNHNIVASEFIGPGSIKTQLKLAESNKVAIALIIGQKEAREGTVILRDVKSGMQELFTTERIIEEVKKRLGK